LHKSLLNLWSRFDVSFLLLYLKNKMPEDLTKKVIEAYCPTCIQLTTFDFSEEIIAPDVGIYKFYKCQKCGQEYLLENLMEEKE